MQVLNAPSREEIDAAHVRSSWMDVGVYSTRNVFKVSHFKRLCWLGLMVTSIPIHLFFNSTVFNTENRHPDFTLTIATEGFVNGASYFLPGASLFIHNNGLLSHDSETSSPADDGLYSGQVAVKYGEIFELEDFIRQGSRVAANISLAAQQGMAWNKLSFSECQEQYGLYGARCDGLTQHSDVILVTTETNGWVRSDMWNLTADQDRLWDTYVPANDENHLFFYTRCSMSYAETVCQNSCHHALGGRSEAYYDASTPAQNWPSGYPFFFNRSLDFVNGTDPRGASGLTSGLQPEWNNIDVQYCLARPTEATCHIGVSPILLFFVLLCLLGKTTIAILFTRLADRQKQKPLITLGDCVASFIEIPDYRSNDYATVSSPELRLSADLRQALSSRDPRLWSSKRPRRVMAVPRTDLVMSIILFLTAIIVCATRLSNVQLGVFTGSFLASSDNQQLAAEFTGLKTFLANVLVANSPQILLSLCYIAFNNLFTYFCVAMEWEGFSKRALPLRVTDPKGEQISTYRLQLPYRYSLPLMALSASFHWLVSNTIYVILTEGGYIGDGLKDDNLPPGVTTILGYSSISLFVLTTVASVTILVPFAFGLKRLSPDTVLVGGNSLLIALACRVSSSPSHSPSPPPSPSPSPAPTPQYRADHAVADRSSTSIELEVLDHPSSTSYRQIETTTLDESSDLPLLEAEAATRSTQTLLEHGPKGKEGEEDLDARQIIARSKLRWGVLPIPPAQSPQTGQEYEFLGFGTETDGVTAPIKGKWYM
ncbi:hypothetical protein F5Y17DRAFT_425755 [Xylariaceae sp. FL0594]|nr:hypothetical protein F5Y17DRAFT_425755 [Xylariaceae sp. FL0594]